MRHRAVFVGVVMLPCLGCVTTLPRERPFTREWANYHQNQREFEERKQRVRGGEWVLFGRRNSTRAAVVMDDEGKPRLNVGKTRGLSADFDIDTDDASVEFKYKKGFTIKPNRDE
ncbi:MAG: hypothetical protein AMXMBFR4_11530 [Candidatus Hydrogenedentota bacterium]